MVEQNLLLSGELDVPAVDEHDISDSETAISKFEPVNELNLELSEFELNQKFQGYDLCYDLLIVTKCMTFGVIY